MFVISVVAIALIPLAVLFLLPHFGRPIEQRRTSAPLITFVVFSWGVSLYLVFTFGLGGQGKSLVIFLGLPALLTYVLFFRRTASATTAQSRNAVQNKRSSLS
jgi:hypothetical protein